MDLSFFGSCSFVIHCTLSPFPSADFDILFIYEDQRLYHESDFGWEVRKEPTTGVLDNRTTDADFLENPQVSSIISRGHIGKIVHFVCLLMPLMVIMYLCKVPKVRKVLDDAGVDRKWGLKFEIDLV